MKPVLLLSTIIPVLCFPAVAPRSMEAQGNDVVQWREMRVRRCPRADTLFGRFWRSHPSPVTVGYSQRRDTTTLRMHVRTVSWQTTSSRLVGTGAEIRLPGRDAQADSARIALSLRFVDSTYRSPEQAPVDIRIDDSVLVEIREPLVDYPMDTRVSGVALIVTFLLSPEQSRALAGAREVRGTMGPYPFYLFDWELWDLNALYRATVCGVEII